MGKMPKGTIDDWLQVDKKQSNSNELEVAYAVFDWWAYGPAYSWIDIHTRDLDVSRMNYLYMKIKGGEPCPKIMKLELVDSKDVKSHYFIGMHPFERINTNEWTNLEIPLRQKNPNKDYWEDNLYWKFTNNILKSLTFVFSDKINGEDRKGRIRK